MPNYDELSHDMTFTLGGETFEVHDVSPDIIEAWEREEADALLADVEDDKNGKVPETAMQRIDRHILAFMAGDTDMTKRYKALRARKGKEAVPAWKFVEFHNDLYETQSGRPTPPPTPLASGAGRTGPTSGAA
jgi:hypothetical protein